MVTPRICESRATAWGEADCRAETSMLKLALLDRTVERLPGMVRTLGMTCGRQLERILGLRTWSWRLA